MARRDGSDDIFAVQRRLSALLAGWGVLSVVSGELIRRRGAAVGSDRAVGFGRQQAGWGAVDAAIAGFGAVRSRQRLGTIDPSDPQVAQTERASLHRLLLINTGLDVVYLAGATMLIAGAERIGARTGKPAELIRGDGYGIAVQGGFLLLLDTAFAAITASPVPPAAS